MEFEKIFTECARAELGFEDDCYFGVGSEAMKRNMKKADIVFDLCLRAPKREYRNDCAKGIVSMYINQVGSYETGSKICVSAPNEFEKVCRDEVSSFQRFFDM